MTTENAIVHHRWTQEEVDMLNLAVQTEKKHSDAFELIGKETNRNPRTVAQKYYGMRRQEKPAKRATMKKVNRPPVKVAKSNSKLDLSTMEHDDLIVVAEGVQAEITRRKQEFADKIGQLAQVQA